MEAILFIGLQASGKSTFYKERFFSTHVRISLDLLRTRHRERALLAVCLQTRQPLVIDNTNPTRDDRERYIAEARAAGFAIHGYYFRSQVEACLRRNRLRGGEVPDLAILGTAKKIELPKRSEGFDRLHYVRLEENGFVIEDWSDDI